MDNIEAPDHRRDIVAAVLSVLPGLGHIYKGYLTVGLMLLFFGTPTALWCGIILSLATLGIGMLIPVMFVAGVMLHAYNAPDHSKHRMLHAIEHRMHRTHHA